MISRIREELLDSNIDIGASEVTETPDGQLRVTMRSGGGKAIMSLFFLVPGILLLVGAFSLGGFAGWILALLFCPVLFGLFALFAFGISEKRFDKGSRMLLKSFRLFGFSMSSSEPLPTDGVVHLESKFSAGGRQSPGGSMRYIVSIPSCAGSGVSAYHDYQIGLDFAEKLASFLSYRVEDSVDPEYRRNMKYPSYQ